MEMVQMWMLSLRKNPVTKGRPSWWWHLVYVSISAPPQTTLPPPYSAFAKREGGKPPIIRTFALQGILSVIPLQLLSYHMAVLKWVKHQFAWIRVLSVFVKKQTNLFSTSGAATLTVRETWPSLWLWNEPATNNGIFTHFCELSELSTFCTLFSNTEYRRTQGRLICIMYPEIQTMHIITGHRPMQALRTLLTK